MDLRANLLDAVKLMNGGRYDEAIELCRSIIETYREASDAWHLRGMCAKYQGDHDRASRLIKVAIALYPEVGHYYWNLFSLANSSATRDQLNFIISRYVAISGHGSHEIQLAASFAKEMSRLDISLALYERIAELYPAEVYGYVGCHGVHRELGNADEERFYYDKAQASVRRNLFKGFVNTVLIETFSYCNRVCPYCPNSINDRRGNNIFMKKEVFEKVLSDLSDIRYSQNVVFQGYNEPMADRSIVDSIREVRRVLPGAKLMISTSGDYLDRDYLDSLYDAGLNGLHISMHLKPGEQYKESGMFKRLEQVEKSIGVSAILREFEFRKSISLTVPYKDMQINIYGTNWSEFGTDRGGLLSGGKLGAPRVSRCYLPLTMFTVHYNGNIMPCCQIVGDNEKHAKYVIGNIEDFSSIYDAYFSEKFVNWRTGLLTKEEKLPPCDRCSHADGMSLPRGEEELKTYHRMIGTFSEYIG